MKTRHYTLDNYRMDEGVGFLLKQAVLAVDKRLAVELKKKCPEATVAQWAILTLLGNKKCATVAELSVVMDGDMGAITRMIDRLEAKGLILRRRSTSDRRVVNLSLTDAGIGLMPMLPAVPVNALNDLLKGFTKKEVSQFKQFLVRIIAAGA
ncbi:MAG: MarR family transcriptional regulator [Deltaproteobacteria bacterium]|nr:MarR family transcriptional regulator [Deltaproteobacteria bacterium]